MSQCNPTKYASVQDMLKALGFTEYDGHFRNGDVRIPFDEIIGQTPSSFYSRMRTKGWLTEESRQMSFSEQLTRLYSMDVKEPSGTVPAGEARIQIDTAVKQKPMRARMSRYPDPSLTETIDANMWAKAFIDRFGGDAGTMILWFATAIQAGRDYELREQEKRTLKPFFSHLVPNTVRITNIYRDGILTTSSGGSFPVRDFTISSSATSEASELAKIFDEIVKPTIGTFAGSFLFSSKKDSN